MMVFRPKRDDFIQTMTPEEQAAMSGHVQHCHSLAAEERIVLLGVCQDGAYGILVFRAESEQAARTFFEDDPAVKAGIVHSELHPFNVVLP